MVSSSCPWPGHSDLSPSSCSPAGPRSPPEKASGWERQKAGARETRLGLASLDHVSRLLAVGVVSSDVTSGPGVITTEDHCLLGCAGQMEPHGSELVGLLVKGVFAEPLLSLRRS